MTPRERDCLIAVKLFGYYWARNGPHLEPSGRFLCSSGDPYAEHYDRCGEDVPLDDKWSWCLPFFSTDPAASCTLEDKLAELGYLIDLIHDPDCVLTIVLTRHSGPCEETDATINGSYSAARMEALAAVAAEVAEGISVEKNRGRAAEGGDVR